MRLARGILAVSLVSVLFPLSAAAQYSILERLRETELTVRAIPQDLTGIPRGAQSVRFLQLAFKASCDADITLRSIRVHLLGRGDAAGFKGVYLLKGSERLTRSTTFSADDRIATLRPTNLVLGACNLLRLDVAADLSPEVAVGSEYRIEVQKREDVVSTATKLSGSFPLRSLSPIEASITPRAAGALTVEFQQVPGKPRVIVDEVLAKFTVEANQDSHHMIYAVTLTNQGSAQGQEIRNLYLTTRGGRSLTQVTKMMAGDAVTLEFSSPYFLEKGQKVGFELHGRLYTSRQTLNFTLKEENDLRAIPQWSRGRKL
ncbi:MAG: hypothetical protein AAB853_02575 [Patescibacteria group bacterium]